MLPRRNAFNSAPLDELLTVLLRQYRRPLGAKGIELTDADAAQIARAIVARAPLDDRLTALREAICELVAESEAVLSRWKLTFAEALDTTMEQINGWETTSEFLEIANEKANAELRIATGAALLVALGDARYVEHLRLLATRPADLDTVIARRVLKNFVETPP